MKIPTVAKLAALSPVGIGLVAVTQMHYVISHFATLAEIGAAVTVGAGIWAGKSILGKGKSEPEAAAAPSVDQQAQAYLDALRSTTQALPKPATVIDYTAAGQAVQKVTKL